MDDELKVCITADLIAIRRIAELASDKGGLIFDVIRQIAEEALDDIECHYPDITETTAGRASSSSRKQHT